MNAATYALTTLRSSQIGQFSGTFPAVVAGIPGNGEAVLLFAAAGPVKSNKRGSKMAKYRQRNGSECEDGT